jgi:glycine cleavage system H protein
VIAVNEALADAPEKVNDDPYGDGWMVKVKLSNPVDLEPLLDGPAYDALLQES